VFVKIPTHDAIWPEDVALAVGRQTNTLVLHAQATHFSQRFKAYLSVKIGGDVFANPLERGLHAHAQKVVHQRFSFPGALGKHAKLGSATGSATGLHLTKKSGLAEFITMSAKLDWLDSRTRSLSDATTAKSTWDSILIASSITTALIQGLDLARTGTKTWRLF